MTVKITEVTREDRATFGMRLQSLREQKSLSRREVAELTGIPMKSIEKFETGVMSPNVERLQSLSQVLEVSVEYLLNGDEPQQSDGAALVEPEARSDEGIDMFDTASAELLSLDAMREEGLQNFWRTAPRTFATAQQCLNELSYDQLLDMAEERGLLPVPQDEIDAFDEMMPEAQEETVLALAERIMDTAYLGIDLYKIKPRSLERLANSLDLEGDADFWSFDTWTELSALVSALRVTLRDLALKGKSPKLTNEKDFPLVEAA